MTFDPGDKVVCINDEFEPWVLPLYTSLPKKDSVYVVRDVRVGGIIKNGKRIGRISLLLVGLVNPSAPGSNSSLAERGFDSDRFRPLEEMRDEAKDRNAATNTVEETMKDEEAGVLCEP